MKVNLREKLALFDGHWQPKVVGEAVIGFLRGVP